jgi:hypothetical protein
MGSSQKQAAAHEEVQGSSRAMTSALESIWLKIFILL